MNTAAGCSNNLGGIYQNMNRFLQILYRLSCGIALIFFGYVFYRTLGNLSHMEIISTYIGDKWAVLFSIIGGLTLLLLFFLLEKLFFCLSRKKQKIVLAVAAAAGIFLQLVVIFGIRPCLRYDSLNPVDTAVALMKGADFPSTASYEYFTIYPHNLPLTAYITVLLSIVRFFGLSEGSYLVFLQLFNCMLIDCSIWGLFCIANRKEERFGFRFLMLCILNPLIYYYPVFFYTQALCIPVLCAMIILFFRLLETKKPKKLLLSSAFFAIAVFFGLKIRILALIAPIACIIFIVLRGSFRFLKEKKFYCSLTVFLTVLLLCSGLNGALLKKLNLITEESKAFPVQHWLMMGLEGEGSYNLADELFTMEIPTKEERAAENTRVFKERAKTLGVSGLLKLWGNKLANTWSDGYDDYADNLTLAAHYRDSYDWIFGYRSEFLAGYLHIYNTACWLLIVLCTVLQLKKKEPGFIYPVLLTIVGGISFHLFWEAGEPYSMPFALLIIFSAAAGLSVTDFPAFENVCWQKPALLVPAALVLGNAALAFHLYPALTSASFDVKEWAAVQDIAKEDYLTLGSGDRLVQTFAASRPFNRVILQYKYASDSEAPARAVFRLYNSAGVCVHEQSLVTEDYFNGWNFEMPLITPNGYETFTAEITAEEAPENSHWVFYAYNTGYFDVYQDGRLFLNGHELENVDLTFSVLNRTERTLL